MTATLSRRARTAAATAVAATAICGALLVPATAHADDAPAGGGLQLSVAELPHSPLINELTRGGEAANFEFDATNPGDTAAAFVPKVTGLPVKGTAPITGSMLTFKGEPIDAPATGSSTGGQDGAALAYLFPKGGKAGDSFTIPAHTTLSWRIVVGVTKDYPATDSGLKLEFAAENADAKTASISFSTTNNTPPAAKQLEVSVEEYPGSPILKTLTPGGKATTFQVNVTNPGDTDAVIAPVFHVFPVHGSAGITDGDLSFTASPVVASGTGFSGGGQDGAALEYLFPKGGKAGDSFTIPAHTQWNWRIVLGVKKNFPAADSGLKVQIVSDSSDVKAGEISFATTGDTTATPSPTTTASTSSSAGSTGATSGNSTTQNTNGEELAHTGSTGTRTLGLLAGAFVLAGAGLSVLTMRRRRGTGA